jgi:hypothetical protein
MAGSADLRDLVEVELLDKALFERILCRTHDRRFYGRPAAAIADNREAELAGRRPPAIAIRRMRPCRG